MDQLHREAHIEAERSKKRRQFLALGFEHLTCVLCGEDDPLCFDKEHPAGRAHGDAMLLLCCNCHRKRSADQRCDPSPSDHPRNVFEVIGRWLLSLASYCELLRDRLRLFGEFLINLAKDSYGDDLSFEF